jgi:hypothetical protein
VQVEARQLGREVALELRQEERRARRGGRLRDLAERALAARLLLG